MPSTQTIRRRSALTAARVVAVTAAVALVLPAGPGVRCRPAAARVGRQRRRVAGPQLRPREHPRHDADADQLPDRGAAQGQVDLRLQGHERLRRLLLDAHQLNGTVYLQDLNSNVYALDRTTGQVKWQHVFNKPSAGPNGVAFGDGRIYGATSTDAFALDAQTGNTLWTRRLTRNTHEGVDMTPQVFDGTVLLSTVPGNISNFYAGNGDGIVWALDAATGQVKWKFNTIADGAKLFGNPDVNSGGGLWYPPSVDSRGRVFISVANPAPLYGTKKFPNGSSRPGPNLYTNSLVALDGQTGKRLWFQQARAARRARLRPDDPGDRHDAADPWRRHRGRAGRRQDGQGVRLPRRQRTAPVDDARRPAPQRHRTADAQGRDDLPRRLRRGRDADGLRSRPALRAVARPGHPRPVRPACGLDRREHERLQRTAAAA